MQNKLWFFIFLVTVSFTIGAFLAQGQPLRFVSTDLGKERILIPDGWVVESKRLEKSLVSYIAFEPNKHPEKRALIAYRYRVKFLVPRCDVFKVDYPKTKITKRIWSIETQYACMSEFDFSTPKGSKFRAITYMGTGKTSAGVHKRGEQYFIFMAPIQTYQSLGGARIAAVAMHQYLKPSQVNKNGLITIPASGKIVREAKGTGPALHYQPDWAYIPEGWHLQSKNFGFNVKLVPNGSKNDITSYSERSLEKKEINTLRKVGEKSFIRPVLLLEGLKDVNINSSARMTTEQGQTYGLSFSGTANKNGQAITFNGFLWTLGGRFYLMTAPANYFKKLGGAEFFVTLMQRDHEILNAKHRENLTVASLINQLIRSNHERVRKKHAKNDPNHGIWESLDAMMESNRTIEKAKSRAIYPF